jgi:hypothetical protein
MKESIRRLAYLLTRRRRERELVDEMDFHREMAARAGGMPLGNVLRLREDARDAWGWTWLDRAAQDLRYAARILRRSPGFTIAAIGMLAIGIGVNVAAFGFLNVAFLRPLQVREPHTLLRFERRAPDRHASHVPYPEMAFLRDHARTLSAVMGVHSARLTTDGEEQPLAAQFVTENFFTELGVSPLLGRTFTRGPDASPGADPIAVLSHGFWQRHFGGDSGIIGRTFRLNGKPVLVTAVAPQGFGGLTLDDPDVWLPITQYPYFVLGSRVLTEFSVDSGVRMWGRMRPDVTPPTVEEDLRQLLTTLRSERPDDIWQDERLVSEPAGRPTFGGGSNHGSGSPQPSKRRMVLLLTGTLALLILAVACANLGSLLLARGVARDREIVIRVAVGAGSARLIRQLFTESLLLAALGSIGGIALGQIVLRNLLAITGAPSWLDATPDWRVMAFTVALAVAAAILFGLAPALGVARQRHRSSLMRQVLIVRALERVTTTHPGFEYAKVVTIDPNLAAHGYSPPRAAAYLDVLRQRLHSLPGVESTALASSPPLGGKKRIIRVDVDGRIADIHVNRIDPEFFQTMGIPLVRGRNLHRGETRAAIASESLGRFLWPGEDPLGKQFDNRVIVGLARSARQMALQDPDAVEAYFPIEAGDTPSLSVVLKAAGPPEAVLQSAVATAKTVDADIFPSVRLLKTSFRDKLRETELSAAAVALLGFSALLLACVGIVGLVAYSVAQRTKEIGIRISLGATGSHIISVVLQQLVRPVVAGLILGVLAAGALSNLLRRELYGISTLDPGAYGSAIGIFVVTVLVAALWPARRALGVDPLRALRID